MDGGARSPQYFPEPSSPDIAIGMYVLQAPPSNNYSPSYAYFFAFVARGPGDCTLLPIRSYVYACGGPHFLVSLPLKLSEAVPAYDGLPHIFLVATVGFFKPNRRLFLPESTSCSTWPSCSSIIYYYA